MRRIQLIMITTAVMAMVSCVTRSSYDNTTIAFSELSAGRTYILGGSGEEYGTGRDLSFVDSVSLLVPTVVDNYDVRELRDSIFKLAFDTTGVYDASIIDSFFKKTVDRLGFEVRLSDRHLDINQADGLCVVTGDVVNLSNEWLVYCVTTAGMTPGAAHGMSSRSYINYSVGKNEILNLDDIFTPEGLAGLPELISQRAAERVETYGTTEVDSLPANGNFYISSDGEICFVYQPYEIASYSQGHINVPFYPYELKSQMSDYGKTLFQLQ